MKQSPRTIASILLAIPLLLTPTLIGGVHLPVIACMGAFAFFAALIAASSSEESSFSPLFLMFAVSVIIAILQLVPLPPSLVQLLSPRGHEHATTTFALLGLEQMPWRSLSMDPHATLDRIVRWGVLALMVFAAGNLGASSKHRLGLQVSILLGALISLAAGCFQKLLDPKLMLGFYEASIPATTGSTFVSWNHAASLYVLCMVVVLGNATSTAWPTKRRIMAVLVGAGFLCAVFLDQSTSAVILGLGGALAFLGIGIAGWRNLVLFSREVRKIVVWAATLICLCGFISVWFAAPYLVDGEGIHTSIRGRVALAKGAWSAGADYLLVGAGAGATERVVYPHIDWSLTQEARIAVVESEIFGWWIELGAVGCVLVTGLLLVTALGPLARGARSRRWNHSNTVTTILSLLVLVVMQLHFPLWALGLGGALFVAWEMSRVQALRGARVSKYKGIERLVLGLSKLSGSRRVALMSIIALGAALIASMVWLVRAPQTDDTTILQMSAREVDATAALVPSEANLFVRSARLASAAGEGARAEDFMERAYHLEPRPRMRAVWAMTMSLAGKNEQAREHYRSIIFGARQEAVGEVILIVLEGVRDPTERALIFLQGEPSLWRRVGGVIRKREGTFAESSFALALLDARGDDLAAFKYVLDIYEQTGRHRLVALWASYLLEAPIEDKAAAREEAIWRMARGRLKSGQREGARALLDEAILSLPERNQKRLTLLWLSALDVEVVLGASAEQRERFSTRRSLACRGELESAERLRCRLVDGWLDEAREDFDSAEKILKGIARQQNTLELANFYARRGYCLRLRRLATQEENASRKKRIELLMERCYKPGSP